MRVERNMVDVVAVCQTATGQENASYWPVVFVVMFASFLSVDVGLTAYSLWRSVNSVSLKGGA